jgi:hypothetical protein
VGDSCAGKVNCGRMAMEWNWIGLAVGWEGVGFPMGLAREDNEDDDDERGRSARECTCNEELHMN